MSGHSKEGIRTLESFHFDNIGVPKQSIESSEFAIGKTEGQDNNEGET